MAQQVVWEYKVARLTGSWTADPVVLDKLGDAGWELVAVICQGPDWTTLAYLKRQVTK